MLIEPATLNEGRLFSLETRVTEEEEMRIKEYDYLREMMKKLLYSLEQMNMSQIDDKGLLKDKNSMTTDNWNLGEGSLPLVP